MNNSFISEKRPSEVLEDIKKRVNVYNSGISVEIGEFLDLPNSEKN